MDYPSEYPPHYNWTDGYDVTHRAVAFEEMCYAQCYPGWQISYHHYTSLSKYEDV